MKKFILIIAFLSISFAGKSQDSSLGNWLVYIGSKQLNSKWNLHHEIQYRNYNTGGDLEQLLLRTGLGYKIGEKSNLLLGYGYINSENFTGNGNEQVTVEEHRIFQQFINKGALGSVSIQHRYRFEQRFVANDFKTRFRYFLGLNIPLKDSKYSLKCEIPLRCFVISIQQRVNQNYWLLLLTLEELWRPLSSSQFHT